MSSDLISLRSSKSFRLSKTFDANDLAGDGGQAVGVDSPIVVNPGDRERRRRLSARTFPDLLGGRLNSFELDLDADGLFSSCSDIDSFSGDTPMGEVPDDLTQVDVIGDDRKGQCSKTVSRRGSSYTPSGDGDIPGQSCWTFVTPGQKMLPLTEDRMLSASQPHDPQPSSSACFDPDSHAPTIPPRSMNSSLASLVSESVNQLNLVMSSDPMAGKTQLELDAHRGIATTAPASIGGSAKWRVLFLDVDGVLNTAPTGPPLQRSLLERLVGVVLYTDAYIVLSTSWRALPELREKLINALHQAGLKMDRVLGRTEILVKPPRAHIFKQRAGQILDWLDRHKHKVESWVALDDEVLANQNAEGMAGHFVQTDPAEGFTMRCAQLAVSILLGLGNKEEMSRSAKWRQYAAAYVADAADTATAS
uniref:FCP1 homology domain-containing protein n=2 Tax=Pyramimonas obovata TaxID=1411642 RepID=A0A7S0QV29_9CHLO|mmetsp:Transcript_16331/g.35499  ORF Transcript_16331/g.35499 Transcript_16331/m.35499 type:complete len:420 (+) Transcript_16331:442-1701(+)|eukprot:CAMPEP_0118957270 /NCGR_PEP_ID=MMETSP1169-20130426/62008_1 /TAXON_ID=36882 /ORGANISM="Pyramimonas obovata, Strain CCMP722" /LENGTH=419 /DNA_ID=CAMNT_0006905331 /DNA_START=1351 /DNA_END=2610 /DNA_ORIENTATION=+